MSKLPHFFLAVLGIMIALTAALSADSGNVPASELHSQKELPQAVLNALGQHPDGCLDLEDRDLVEAFGGFALKMPGEEVAEIYIVPCGAPGAYNLVQTALVHAPERGSARVVYFPTMGNNGPTVSSTIFNGTWNEDTQQLTAFYKGRGLGDCGVFSAWKWNGSGIFGNFELVEERRKDDCDGNFDDEWPKVWPVD